MFRHNLSVPMQLQDMAERQKFRHDLEPSPPVDSGAPNSPFCDCQIQGWSFSQQKGACGKIPISNRACQIQGCSCSRKKSACGKIPISNRVCQIQGWSFSPKKSACGKIPISNRVCQIQGWSFSRKKVPAARYIAAAELLKVRIMAASWVSTTIR